VIWDVPSSSFISNEPKGAHVEPASEVVSLAGDIRLNSLYKMARPHDIVEDFGIDDKLPSTPLLFILEAGTHHKYQGPLLVYAPDGIPALGKRHPVHNQKGIFHKVKISSVSGKLKLGPRRQDIEAHNINPPDRWLELPTPIPLLSPNTQLIQDQARQIERKPTR
jgi:hypothetical protein